MTRRVSEIAAEGLREQVVGLVVGLAVNDLCGILSAIGRMIALRTTHGVIGELFSWKSVALSTLRYTVQGDGPASVDAVVHVVVYARVA